MSTSCDNEIPMFDFSIVRELRKRQNLTIAQVCQRSGISPAVISKLERNQTKAELETLFKLSRVFGINATDLISLAESRTAQKKTASPYSSSGFHFRKISYNRLECFHGHANKGAKVSRPEVHQDEYEICWVLTGRVLVTLPNEKHELGAGESLFFDALLDHAYEALEDCTLVTIHLEKDKRF